MIHEPRKAYHEPQVYRSSMDSMHQASGPTSLQVSRRAAKSLHDPLRCVHRVLSARVLRRYSALCFVLAMFTALPCALAHPDLDQALASAEEAEFDAALSSFERALDSGTLTRDELVTLLTERSLVLHALGQRGALAWDLANLALIEPGRDLGRRAPPELVEAFSRATARQGAAVSVSATCSPSSTGLQVSTTVTGLSDPSLARVKLRTRRADGAEIVHDASDVQIAVGPGESLSYSAELVGMGNVVLAQDGSAGDPKVCEVPNLDEPPVAVAGTDKRDGKSRKLWWWLGAAGVVAVTAVTVGLVVANGKDDSSDDTSVGRPMVMF